MIVFETGRGPFHLIDVHYPQPFRFSGIGKSLRLNEVVCLHQLPAPLAAVDFAAPARVRETTLTDLASDLDVIFR